MKKSEFRRISLQTNAVDFKRSWINTIRSRIYSL